MKTRHGYNERNVDILIKTIIVSVYMSVSVLVGTCAESIATDVLLDGVYNATWTEDYKTAFTKAGQTGYPVLTFWAASDQVSGWARQALNTKEFRSFLKKHNIYLVYVPLYNAMTKGVALRFYKQLFSQVDPSYDGFPQGTMSTSIAADLPLPVFTLNTVDSGKTNFLFHIIRNWYNTDRSGIFSPYADSITWHGHLFISTDAPEGYQCNFLKVLEEYLDGKVPDPVDTTADGNVSMTKSSVAVRLDNIASRFVISVNDILIEEPFDESEYATDFTTMAKAGTWFVDKDGRLRAVNMDVTASQNGLSWIRLKAKGAGILQVSSPKDNPIEVKLITDSHLTAYVASDAVSMDSDGSFRTNIATAVSTVYDGNVVEAINTNFVLTAGQVIELQGGNTAVCDIFDFRRFQ